MPHHDQVTFEFIGDAKDLRRRIPFFQKMFDGDLGIARLDVAQLLIKRFPIALGRRRHGSSVPDDGWDGDMQDDQPPIVVSGQRTGQVKGIFGKRRKISRMQDRCNSKHGTHSTSALSCQR